MAIGFVHLLLQCIGELYFFCSWKECNFSWRSRGTIYLEAIITFQPFQGLFKPHVLQHIFRNSLVYGKLVFLLPQKLLVIFVFIIFTVNQFLQDHNKINGNSLQYSCLESSMDRGAWQATVHGVTKESDMTEQVNN